MDIRHLHGHKLTALNSFAPSDRDVDSLRSVERPSKLITRLLRQLCCRHLQLANTETNVRKCAHLERKRSDGNPDFKSLTHFWGLRVFTAVCQLLVTLLPQGPWVHQSLVRTLLVSRAVLHRQGGFCRRSKQSRLASEPFAAQCCREGGGEEDRFFLQVARCQQGSNTYRSRRVLTSVTATPLPLGCPFPSSVDAYSVVSLALLRHAKEARHAHHERLGWCGPNIRPGSPRLICWSASTKL
eukprot:4674546-Amphidinium_carterae.1